MGNTAKALSTGIDQQRLVQHTTIFWETTHLSPSDQALLIQQY